MSTTIVKPDQSVERLIEDGVVFRQSLIVLNQWLKSVANLNIVEGRAEWVVSRAGSILYISPLFTDALRYALEQVGKATE